MALTALRTVKKGVSVWYPSGIGFTGIKASFNGNITQVYTRFRTEIVLWLVKRFSPEREPFDFAPGKAQRCRGNLKEPRYAFFQDYYLVFDSCGFGFLIQ